MNYVSFSLVERWGNGQTDTISHFMLPVGT